MNKVEKTIWEMVNKYFPQGNPKREQAIAQTEQLLAVQGKNFTSFAQARKLTGFSYLGAVGQSQKGRKAFKYKWDNYILYLAPTTNSGFQMCPTATAGCKEACLFTSGHGGMIETGQTVSQTGWSRIRKTWLLMLNRPFFMAWLDAEIKSREKAAIKNGHKFCVRVNGTSDLGLNMYGSIIKANPNVQFYDYTKMVKNVRLSDEYKNHDVVYSFANSDEFNNIANTLEVLANGGKISVVFDLDSYGKKFPKTFLGYEVVDGDKNDLVHTQPPNTVLGLAFKRNGSDKTNNSFILTPKLEAELEQRLGVLA